jgi:hypothetical protein
MVVEHDDDLVALWPHGAVGGSDASGQPRRTEEAGRALQRGEQRRRTIFTATWGPVPGWVAA